MTIVIGTRKNGTPAWLSDPAGRCWQALEAQGLPDSGITDAGRTRAEQAALYARYRRGELVATAARPDSPEAHHQDMPPDGAHAVDLTGASQSWMLAHHPACWSRPLLPREPWHWEHDATRCANQPATPAPMEVDMKVVHRTTDNTFWAVTPLSIQPIVSQAAQAALTATWGQPVNMDAVAFDGLRAQIVASITDTRKNLGR